MGVLPCIRHAVAVGIGLRTGPHPVRRGVAESIQFDPLNGQPARLQHGWPGRRSAVLHLLNENVRNKPDVRRHRLRRVWPVQLQALARVVQLAVKRAKHKRVGIEFVLLAKQLRLHGPDVNRLTRLQGEVGRERELDGVVEFPAVRRVCRVE